jgi:hypothetical protein
MLRQQALNTIWKRLFFIFTLLLILSVVLASQTTGYQVPLIVFITGNIGGYVGFHRRLASLTDEEIIHLSSTWFGVTLPSFIGGILAGVLYILFISGVVSGDLFPKIIADQTPTCLDPKTSERFEVIFCQHAEGYASYAKLLFWSFVAGFNQNYVVDLIESLKGSDNATDANATDKETEK